MSRRPGNVVPIRPVEEEPSLDVLTSQLEELEAKQSELEGQSDTHAQELTSLRDEMGRLRGKLCEIRKQKSGDIVRRTGDLRRTYDLKADDS